MRVPGRHRSAAQHHEAPPSKDKAGGAWYADPFATGAERWWDGGKWTEQVRGVPTAGAADAVAQSLQSTPPTRDVATRGDDEMPHKLPTGKVCPNCRGTGRDLALGYTCNACMGKGRMTDQDRREWYIAVAICIAITIVLIVLRSH